jgi:hypothetical protein
VFFDVTGRLCDEIAIASLDLRSKIELLARNNRALQLSDEFLRDRRDNVALLEAALGFTPPMTETLPAERNRPRGRTAIPGAQIRRNVPDHLAGDMWHIDRSIDVDGDKRYFHDNFWKYSNVELQCASSIVKRVSAKVIEMLIY